MARRAKLLADDFSRRLKTYESARRNIERLSKIQAIPNYQVNLFYEGTFLRTVTSFEGFLEDLFLGLSCGALKGHHSVTPRINFTSMFIARDIIWGGKSYIDWLPYSHTEKRAATYFRAGHPFSVLDKPEKKELERISIIRNAIAHQSQHSKTRFTEDVIGSLTLLPAERTPSGFLRSAIGVAPVRTRYEEIAGTLNLLAQKLATAPRP